jgi:hypothetical protein
VTATAAGRTARGILLLGAALLATGCGGTTHPRAVAGQPAGRRGDYRWLIPTSGPQPTVAQENAHQGTTAWRLPGPAADVGGLDRGAITGYVASPAVAPGQRQRVYVDAGGAKLVRVQVFRMGWYGGRGGREVLASRWLAAVHQPTCPHYYGTGLTVCHWHPTLDFTVPPALPSGVYIAKLSSSRGAGADALFVVRATHPAPILAQLPDATYEAYNAWGGDSLYPGGTRVVRATGTTQGVAVSYQRPYDSVTGAGQFFARDVAMIRFLERYRFPVSYTDSASMAADPGQVRGRRALLDFGHSEYWSQGERQAWTRARDAGTSLVMLSSDTLAWRVRFEDGAQVIVAYKEHAGRDPDKKNPSGEFADGGAPLAGSAYVGCITPRLDQPGPPTYRYYAWSPPATLSPPWLFAHTGVSARTALPGIVGYELDRTTPLSPRRTAIVGGGVAPCSSASSEPGEPQPGPGGDRADTTLYTARSGAIVFSSGTLGWELGLEPVPSASPDAPRAPLPPVVVMTRNVLTRALRLHG